MSLLYAFLFPKHRFDWQLDISARDAERRLRRATDPRPHYTPFDQDIGLFRGEIDARAFKLKLRAPGGLRASNVPSPLVFGELEDQDAASILHGRVALQNISLILCLPSTLFAAWFFGGWEVLGGRFESLLPSLTAGLLAFCIANTQRVLLLHGQVKSIKAALRTALSGDESSFYPFSG
ncbi:MAG: hypothetical protein QM667_06930 [Asticcacaulis sp.]